MVIMYLNVTSVTLTMLLMYIVILSISFYPCFHIMNNSTEVADYYGMLNVC
jgi:hypothetical protein